MGLRHALANTLLIIAATAVLHNFALMHRKQDFDDDIENEDVPFDIVAAADTSLDPKRQLIFSRYFAIYNSNGFIRFRVRFIDNKIGNKKYSLQLINLLILLFSKF